MPGDDRGPWVLTPAPARWATHRWSVCVRRYDHSRNGEVLSRTCMLSGRRFQVSDRFRAARSAPDRPRASHAPTAMPARSAAKSHQSPPRWARKKCWVSSLAAACTTISEITHFRWTPARMTNQVTQREQPEVHDLVQRQTLFWMPGARGRTAPRTGRATPALLRCGRPRVDAPFQA